MQTRFLSQVRELLTHPDHFSVVCEQAQDTGLIYACQQGHLDIVKYLLTSHELIQAGHSYARLHAEKNRPLRLASLKTC